MNIQITAEDARSIEAVANKTSVFIYTDTLDRVWVLCQNASHRVWRGSGRPFNSFEEAVKGYKKPEMKAIIELAQLRIS